MSSLARRIQRRIAAKINDADPEKERYRICERVKGLTHRQAQRGITEPPKGDN
jgi:hypothetical protein